MAKKKKEYNPLDAEQERIKRIEQSKARMNQVREISSIYTFQSQFWKVYEQKRSVN